MRCASSASTSLIWLRIVSTRCVSIAVQDLGGHADTADTDANLLRLTRQQILDRFVELADRRRRDGIERRKARDHLLDKFLRQMMDQRVGLLRLHISEDHRDDLRVLVLDHFSKNPRVLKLDRLDPRKVIALMQSGGEPLGLVRPERAFEHAVDVGLGADADRRLLQHRVDEFLIDRCHLGLRHALDARHGHRQQVYLELAHMLHHLGGGLFADRQHDDRRFLEVGEAEIEVDIEVEITGLV